MLLFAKRRLFAVAAGGRASGVTCRLQIIACWLCRLGWPVSKCNVSCAKQRLLANAMYLAQGGVC